jgi:hypothetical protein
MLPKNSWSLQTKNSMANKYYTVIAIVILSMLLACSVKSMDPDRFITYCNSDKSGLIQKRTFGTVLFSLKYEPVEYKALIDLHNEKQSLSTDNFNKVKKEYEGLYYFVFKMEAVDSEKSPIKSLARNEEDLSKLQQYCQSNLAKDFYLESGGTKIPCVIFHIEDDYNITNTNLISIAFETKNIDADKDLVFVFNDPFFNHGLIKFNISKESVLNLPKLKFT